EETSGMDMEIVFPGGLQVDAIMGDMLVETNQAGSAPAPFGLCLASIGTCAGTYVPDFCEQRALPTENIRIIQRMHASPLTRMVERIELDIQLPAGFPEKYRDAVIRAADQCAVKKHLASPPQFDVYTTEVALA